MQHYISEVMMCFFALKTNLC